MEDCYSRSLASQPLLMVGWLRAFLPKKQFRKPKKIPYPVLIFEPDTPSWSSCEYSSTPNIWSIEQEVSYPLEITLVDFMTDFQVRRMAKTKSTSCMRSLHELLAEGTQGNPCSAPSSSQPVTEVASTSTSSSSGGISSYSSDGSLRCLSS